VISRTVTAVLPAPREEVFEFLSKAENLPLSATDFARELKYEGGKAKVVNGLESSTSRLTPTPRPG
jgi:hypothetical protein